MVAKVRKQPTKKESPQSYYLELCDLGRVMTEIIGKFQRLIFSEDQTNFLANLEY